MAAPRPPLFEQTWFLTVTEASAAWQREGERYELAWGGGTASALRAGAYSGIHARSRARTASGAGSPGAASHASTSSLSRPFSGTRALATRSFGCGVGSVCSASASSSS